VSVPVEFGVTVTATVAVAGVVRVPTLHVSLTGVVALAVQLPPVVLIDDESYWTQLGRVSVSVSPDQVIAELLVIVEVNVTGVPAVSVELLAFCVRPGSAVPVHRPIVSEGFPPASPKSPPT